MKFYQRGAYGTLCILTTALFLSSCTPSPADKLTSSGYEPMGEVEDSTFWIAKNPDSAGKFGIAVTGKFQDFCHGSVLAGNGEQICNMGEPGRGVLYIIGAPSDAASGTLTLTDGSTLQLKTLAIPGHDGSKVAVASSPTSTRALGFMGIEFERENGTVIDVAEMK